MLFIFDTVLNMILWLLNITKKEWSCLKCKKYVKLPLNHSCSARIIQCWRSYYYYLFFQNKKRGEGELIKFGYIHPMMSSDAVAAIAVIAA